MKEAEIDKGNVDPILRNQFVPKIKKTIKESDDDRLYICVGETGTGKSTVFLHLLELYMEDNLTTDIIGLDRQQIADALKICSKMKHPKAWLVDEANINKRDAMTKFNKDMIDLYMAIRGLNILHLWCNPSLDMIDSTFISERVRGVFLCTKKTNSIRPYFYFKKKDILKILKKYKDLKIETLYKVRRRYARYRGWYRDYNGDLKKKYLEMKQNRMEKKVEIFQEKYGSKIKNDFSKSDIAKILKCSPITITNYYKRLVKNEKLEQNKDYCISATGRIFFKEHTIKLFEEESKKGRRTLLK